MTHFPLILSNECRYEILRDKLLLEMLKHHIGEGMWTVLSEHEQSERFMQVKMRVQRLRKDAKLDDAVALPGANLACSASLLSLMGLSRTGEEKQRVEEAEMIKQLEAEGRLACLVCKLVLKNHNQTVTMHNHYHYQIRTKIKRMAKFSLTMAKSYVKLMNDTLHFLPKTEQLPRY